MRGLGRAGPEALFQDTRHAMRRLVRESGFAATAILILAIGIGACTAMFSIVQAVLLRPFGVAAPRPHPHHLAWPYARLDGRGAFVPPLSRSARPHAPLTILRSAHVWRSRRSAPCRDGPRVLPAGATCSVGRSASGTSRGVGFGSPRLELSSDLLIRI
jgi:hypothetical protein